MTKAEEVLARIESLKQEGFSWAAQAEWCVPQLVKAPVGAMVGPAYVQRKTYATFAECVIADVRLHAKSADSKIWVTAEWLEDHPQGNGFSIHCHDPITHSYLVSSLTDPPKA